MKISRNLSGLPDNFVSGDALTSKLDPKILAQQEATPFIYCLLAGNSDKLQLPQRPGLPSICSLVIKVLTVEISPAPLMRGPFFCVNGESELAEGREGQQTKISRPSPSLEPKLSDH